MKFQFIKDYFSNNHRFNLEIPIDFNIPSNIRSLQDLYIVKLYNQKVLDKLTSIGIEKRDRYLIISSELIMVYINEEKYDSIKTMLLLTEERDQKLKAILSD